MAEKDYHQYEMKFKATDKVVKRALPIIKMIGGLEDLRLVKKRTKKTSQQTKALHLWFKQVADVLNEGGMDRRKILKSSILIPWSSESIKRDIWKPLLKTMYGVESTTEMKRHQINPILNIIYRELGKRAKGIELPEFPNRDLLEQKEKQDNLLKGLQNK